MRLWRPGLVLGVIGALALTACTVRETSPPAAGSPVGQPPAPAPASAPAATRPALCDGSQPAEQTPFPFNRDSGRRDTIAGAGARYLGGISYFEDLDAAELAALLDEKFIDPRDQQNLAPSAWAIFRFLCEHPTVRAMGYVVSPDRGDYRTSITTVYAPRVDAGLRADAQAFCVDAEATFDGHLECFWD
ncbi:MAG TPA: hypothetical protein VF062_29160 [Candidatus Limnocylindrales bacterium]